MAKEAKVKSVEEIIAALAEPFDESDIEWRVGSMTRDKKKGMALAYIQARAVMNRLDSVVGAANWKASFKPINLRRSTTSGYGENARDVEKMEAGFLCTLSLRIDGEWIEKEDTAGCTDIEPIKGGVSDSLKRAASQWGIGRYLYDTESTWVELDEYKRMKTRPKLVMKAGKASFKGASEPKAETPVAAVKRAVKETAEKHEPEAQPVAHVKMTAPQNRKLFALLNDLQAFDEKYTKEWLESFAGPVEEITKEGAKKIIDKFEQKLAEMREADFEAHGKA